VQSRVGAGSTPSPIWRMSSLWSCPSLRMQVVFLVASQWRGVMTKEPPEVPGNGPEVLDAIQSSEVGESAVKRAFALQLGDSLGG